MVIRSVSNIMPDLENGGEYEIDCDYIARSGEGTYQNPFVYAVIDRLKATLALEPGRP